MKKIKELAITDKNGNVGYIDLTSIDSNTANIDSLEGRVSALENGDFQYADKDYSDPANFSEMVLGTYYLVPFNENNEYTTIESNTVHHFDVLVRLSTVEPPKKIRTQYVQSNIKDVAYTNKNNTFTGDNHFTGYLKVDNLGISSVSKNLVESDLENTKSISFNINQTDYKETNEDGSKIEYAKNLASLYVGADSELQVAELSVENKNYKIGIKSTNGGVQTFAPIPNLETSSDTEIATVSNVRNLKTDLQAKITENFNSIANLQGNVSDLYGKVWEKVQVIDNEEDAKWDGIAYFVVDEIPPKPEPSEPSEPTEPENPETPEN